MDRKFPRLTPRKEPRQGRSRALVDAVLIATGRVIGQGGFEAATTTEIARVAGVSVGSLYQYFPNVESCAVAYLQRFREELVDEVAAQAVEGDDLDGICRACAEAFVEMHEEDAATLREILRHVPLLGAQRKLVDVDAREVEVWKNLLRQRAAEVRPGDHALAAQVLVRAVRGVVEGALHAGQLEGEGLVSELTELLRGYLRAAP